ncbi:MAG: isoleucine--tRNA ligase [Bryobacteraceae bacterium]|jgi:isoleucyl-tRNA synthetase
MDSSKPDYKKTVNLPQTGFPMKANLVQREPEMLARWEKEGLYEAIRAARAGQPQYILHDGPPYANGHLHLGTAFNKILKDFIVRLKNMEGYDSPYIPGWDCHGLPIENKVDAELGPKKAQMTAVQIRAACRKYAEKFVNIQRDEFKRLGGLGRWQDPYLTMSAHYQSVIAGAFVDVLEQGYVYKGLKPVNWCIHHRTALAEAEVEYEDHTSPSIWVRFALQSHPAKIDTALAGRKVWGLIWTTTPWTIPANMAIAYHPKFEYVAAEVNGEVYIVARDLLNVTAEAAGWVEPKVIASFPGSRLERSVFRHPLFERDSLGILGDHVTLEQGTGAVHTAPGHGQEDYVVGQQYGIATYCPVDAAGRFFRAEGAPGVLPEEIIGKTVFEANPIVVELLQRVGALVAQKNIEHSYPHCWRCHNPTIFRATEQWFIGMERNDLRQRALTAIHNVKWLQEWGESRIGNMIAARPDWCISRQRVWGVPIIAFYCEACNEPITDSTILRRVVKLFAEHTADVWYEKSAAELAGPDAKCPKCGAAELRKETDILDVWFDSGSSHLAVLNQQNGLRWPSDLYIEGGDQYRGWFHSSLLIGVALRGEAPYRACATHGWALDEHGRAMSKSLGNTIEPQEVIKKYGADVLRLWCAAVDYSEDVRISDTILERLSEAYRKIRNTVFRYALGNLYDFDPARDAVPADQLPEIDQWILLRAEELVRKCRGWYHEFAFHKVYRAIYDFATTDLSAVYFDVLKDRLYTAAATSHARRSGQTAVYRLAWALVRLLAPLLAFTMDEVWSYLPKPAESPASVHLALLPEPEELTEGIPAERRERLKNWVRLMEVRETVLKNIATARDEKLVGTSLEARVRLRVDGDLYPLLHEYAKELPALFIVSQVALENGNHSGIGVDIERAEGEKCARCWKYRQEVGASAAYPTLCADCQEAISAS